MYFRHILAKIQPKNMKQHFDWGVRVPLGFPWIRPWTLMLFQNCPCKLGDDTERE